MAVLLTSTDGDPVLVGVYGPREYGISILCGDKWLHQVLSTSRLFDPVVTSLKRMVAAEYKTADAIIVHPKEPDGAFKCIAMNVQHLTNPSTKSFPNYDAAVMYCHILVR